MAGKGHNSGAVVSPEDKKALKSFIERIENLDDQKNDLAVEIRGVYAEAKAAGFDTKVLRQVIRRRLMDRADREQMDMLMELYEGVLS